LRRSGAAATGVGGGSTARTGMDSETMGLGGACTSRGEEAFVERVRFGLSVRGEATASLDRDDALALVSFVLLERLVVVFLAGLGFAMGYTASARVQPYGSVEPRLLQGENQENRPPSQPCEPTGRFRLCHRFGARERVPEHRASQWVEMNPTSVMGFEGEKISTFDPRHERVRRGVPLPVGADSSEAAQPMTYCLAIQVNQGIAFASDTRSNAGVDYVSAYRKLHQFDTTPDRRVALLSAGSLATTQEVVARLRRDVLTNATATESLNTFSHLFEIAAYIGRVSRSVQASHRQALAASGISPQATFILGGQVRGERPGIYLIYSEGNFIQASDDTPYLQIGETKYGKPVLDRIVHPDLTLDQAIRLAVLSLDATIKSNVTVGPPLDLAIYQADGFGRLITGRLDQTDSYYSHMSEAWNTALLEAFARLPDFKWPAVANAKIVSE